MSIHNYTYRFELKPNKLQTVLLNKHIGACRFVYNYFLSFKKEHYRVAKENELEKKSLSYADTTKILTVLKSEEKHWWMKEVNSQTLQQALKNLDGAYNSFFKGLAEFPKFHSKDHTQAFRVPQFIEIIDNKIKIPKFKEGIKFVKHREVEGKICNATISKEPTGKFFVVIVVEKHIEELPKTNKAVGLDIGIKSLVVCSNGQSVSNPRNTNKHSTTLRKLQRKLSRKFKKADKIQLFDSNLEPIYKRNGQIKFKLIISNNINKLKTKVAKVHAKITNKRKDHIHKATKVIVENNDVIVIEDLNTKGMLRNRKLSKAISDASFGEIKRQLEYKSKWYGKQIVKISRWLPSSKTCSSCGNIKQNLKLSERVFTCSQCAFSDDRDLNASKNILVQGLNQANISFNLKTAGMAGLACGISSSGVLAFVNTSYDMLNQEAHGSLARG